MRMSSIVLCIFVVVSALAWERPAEAALCPTASNSSICVDFTEPSGVTNLKDTVVTIKRNGGALPSVTIPASAATGGGQMSTSMPTRECQSDTYTAEAYSQYNTALGVMKSLVVQANPGAGVLKDRTGEAVCFKVPVNPTLH